MACFHDIPIIKLIYKHDWLVTGDVAREVARSIKMASTIICLQVQVGWQSV